MSLEHSALVAAMAPYESFDAYTARRVFPPAFRIARASVIVYVVLQLLDFLVVQDRAVFLDTILFRGGALVALLLMTAALSGRWFAGHRVVWTFFFGLVAEALIVYWTLFFLNQPALVIFILMYFMFGVLTVAPAVTMFQYLWAALVTAGHVGLQMGLNQVSTEVVIQVAFFIIPALAFLGHAVFSQRNAAREMWKLSGEVHRHANIDTLSEVLNRGTWYSRSTHVLAQRGEVRTGENLAFIMLDIDHFKAINDTWGHDAGDIVIRLVAREITAEIREGDVVGRLGGEEFGVLLPSVDAPTAMTIAERIRRRVESLTIDYHGHSISVTASLGFCVDCYDKPDLDELVRKGDECLYRAKRAGRNRVEGWFREAPE